jgi:signal transduction histidine kinase
LDQKQFLEEFAEMLGMRAVELTPSTQLSNLDNWESVAYLSTIVLIDEKFGVTISPDDLTSAQTIQDILNAGGPATLAPLISEKRGRITCSTLPEVDADPVLLALIFQNLVSNALQYHCHGETPVIEISGGTSGDFWQFAVKDNGQEIPPDHQDHVFEPLKRLHGNDRRYQPHTFFAGSAPNVS